MLSEPAANLTYQDVTNLIKTNNKGAQSTELIVALIWKESSFNPAATSTGSTATGLMQLTKDAVADVNSNTPSGIHFEHTEMKTPDKNIQCGTYYLAIKIKLAGGDLKKGLESYGTGTGYGDNILVCEKCIQTNPSGYQSCLNAIHM